MERKALKIGITLGDPAGIGPEVALKALSELHNPAIIPVLIGRSAILQSLYPALYNDFITTDLKDDPVPYKKYLFDVVLDSAIPVPGQGTPDTGMESRLYIDTAIGLWSEGLIDAVVTGPVSKGLIEKSGVHFTGHTEYIAEKIGETGPLMMMFSEKYRVLLVTTHIPLDHVTASIDKNKIFFVIKKGNESMKSIDGGHVKIAIAGLDPHCGDDGAIGAFDRDITSAAVEAARREGVDIDGPIPADALFHPQRWSKYNVAIVHYHDQGLIPFKMLAFDDGVNVTLGLSITRTSVDHGTAFDIAGKGLAQHRSMINAIELAYRLEAGRRGII